MIASGTAGSTSGADLESVVIDSPVPADGVAIWRLADDSGVLDVNSRYAYVLWCRDFARTTVVARMGGRVVGFVTGYQRQDEPSTLMVWQVAVGADAQGRGVAGAMLDALAERVRPQHLETTVSPDNVASTALFTRFAQRHDAPLERSELFGTDVLGAGHEPEFLHRIGPIAHS
jgi:L-2,4-diaminobutyric acid acetyltransferase